ncbi:hypothetical protein [Bradyrhizobium lablabi]|uniref:hypothetical protein n=1 Tax=Bradyrhizobium lablabi TaxID=722472 RepID=UPI001BA517E0|nr:hypothetical protein [Bradyrhizobium lablabi]MBR0695213.1 hypothetical protein [Bradyrhizobium lablabi]
MGRRPRPIRDALEFGWLVEQERLQSPRLNQDALFHKVRRAGPQRWGSRATMYRLWSIYRKQMETRRQQLEADMRAWARRPSKLLEVPLGEADTGPLKANDKNR